MTGKRNTSGMGKTALLNLTVILTLAILAIWLFPGGVGAAATNEVRPDAPTATQDFQDIPTTDPFYSFLHNIGPNAAQIVGGYTCGGTEEPCVPPNNLPYYRPGSAVTRLQMSKFVDLARKQPGINITTTTSLLPLYSGTSAANGIGVKGESPSGTGVYGLSNTGDGVYGISTSGAGVRGLSTNGAGVAGSSGHSTGYGVYGENTAGGLGVAGRNTSNSNAAVDGRNTGNSHGVYGQSAGGNGVHGVSASGNGIYGTSTSTDISTDAGVNGRSTATNGTGVIGEANSGSQAFGVWGKSTSGYAGWFEGNVRVTGTCTGCARADFEIDNPLDPANKYLRHSSVASPDMLNIYSGNVTTDAQGNATAVLPDYFEALNTDFRYQLTVVGQFAQAIVNNEIENNSFTIKTDKPNVKVSWLVTSVRNDPYTRQHPVQVEESKADSQRGYYLNPELYGQPDTKKMGSATGK